MTREEMQYLRDQGLTYREIGERAGISWQSVQKRLTYTPTGGKRGRKPLPPDVRKKRAVKQNRDRYRREAEQQLRQAARKVVNSWETGDLAAAVRELAQALEK